MANKRFSLVADLDWSVARISYFRSDGGPLPFGDQLVIISPDDTDESGYAPSTCVKLTGEKQILALHDLINLWIAERTATAASD